MQELDPAITTWRDLKDGDTVTVRRPSGGTSTYVFHALLGPYTLAPTKGWELMRCTYSSDGGPATVDETAVRADLPITKGLPGALPIKRPEQP